MSNGGINQNNMNGPSAGGFYYNDQYVQKVISFRGFAGATGSLPQFDATCRFHRVGQQVILEIRAVSANSSPSTTGITSYQSLPSTLVPSEFIPLNTGTAESSGRTINAVMWNGTNFELAMGLVRDDGTIRFYATGGGTFAGGAAITSAACIEYFITA